MFGHVQCMENASRARQALYWISTEKWMEKRKTEDYMERRNNEGLPRTSGTRMQRGMKSAKQQ